MVRRFAAKRDDNEERVVSWLRAHGCSVQRLSAPGVPDLLVGFRGANVLVEIKDGEKIQSRRHLTPEQERWHLAWRGQVAVAETPEEAMAIVAACASKVVPF